jgi:hypothetical protein
MPCKGGNVFVHDGSARLYLVERELPGITMEELADAQAAQIAACARLTARGKSICYLRSTFVLGQDRLLCLFVTANARLIQDVSDAAGLPFTWIVEVLDLSPPA